VNRRDQVAAGDAVMVLLRKGAGAEMRRCASATLAALGVDEFTVLADARARTAPSGVPGALRKDVSTPVAPGAITVRAPMDGGTAVLLEMSPGEAVSLAAAVHDALARRGVR